MKPLVSLGRILKSPLHSSCIHQNPTIHRNKTYLLNQWMDLMYLSTLDLPGSLISESRTSASSSLQVSMDLPTCTHPNTLPIPCITQHVRTLYTDNPHITQTCTQLVHRQPTYNSTCTHLVHRQPTYTSENRVLL
jgi:hypothetical protein